MYTVPFKIAAEDLSPDVPLFTSVANATPGMMAVNAAPVYVPGITGTVPMEIDAGYPADYLLSADNGATWARRILVNQHSPVRVRMNGPPAGQTHTVVIRTGSSDQSAYPGGTITYSFWSVSSSGPDTLPDPFPDLSQTLPLLNSGYDVSQNRLVITGITVPVTATVQEIIPPGETTWITWLDHLGQFGDSGQSVQVQPNENLRMVVNSPGHYNAVRTIRLTVGERSIDYTFRTPTGDTTPNAFTFPSSANVDANTLNISNGVIPDGYTLRTMVAISGNGNPMISVNNGAFGPGPMNIEPGQNLRVQMTAPSIKDGSSHTATITFGAPGTLQSTASYTVSTIDHAPNSFSFTSQSGVEPQSWVASNSVTLSGLAVNTPFTTSAGGITINNSSILSNGTVSPGDVVRFWAPAGVYGESKSFTLNVGIGSAAFTVQARVADYSVDPYTVPTLANVPADAQVVSAWVQPTGNLDPVWVNVNGGTSEVQIEGEGWTSSALLNPGQRFRLRTISLPYAQVLSVKVRVGQNNDTTASQTTGVLTTWSVRTAGAP